MFEQFWKLYPRKVAKRIAERAWKRLTPAEQKLAMEAVSNHVKYWDMKYTNIEFIPHPATWLNQGRFEDELDFVVKEKPVIVQQLIKDFYKNLDYPITTWPRLRKEQTEKLKEQ
jgi:hypothetical protein